MTLLIFVLSLFSTQAWTAEFKSLSVKGQHSCAIKDGGVYCWGGQQIINVPQGLAKNAKAVQVGIWHACAIDGEDQLKCWGNPRYSNIWQAPANLPKILSLAVGEYHTCVETSDEIICFGDRQDRINKPANFKSMIAGNSFLCIHAQDQVTCSGEVGSVPPVPPELKAERMFAMNPWESYRRDFGVCVVANDQSVSCYNTYGFGAWGTELGAITAYSPGRKHLCYVRDERLTCEAANPDASQPGEWEKLIMNPPQDVRDARNVKNLAVGDDFACVQLTNRVRCWGNSYAEQSLTHPALMGPIKYKTDNSWGENCYVGIHGDISCHRSMPLERYGWPNNLSMIEAINAVEIREGFQRSCLLAGANNDIYCWGLGTRYLGKPTETLRPGVVRKLKLGATLCALYDRGADCSKGFERTNMDQVVDIGAGTYTSCLHKTDQSVECISNGGSAALFGYSSDIRVAKLFVDSHTACGITSAGSVTCWGDQFVGALNVPAGLHSVKTIELNSVEGRTADSACAILESNERVCWGSIPYQTMVPSKIAFRDQIRKAILFSNFPN